MSEAATHAYVGRCPVCGAMKAFMADDIPNIDNEHTAWNVFDMIRSGLKVERVTVEEARDGLKPCPHRSTADDDPVQLAHSMTNKAIETLEWLDDVRFGSKRPMLRDAFRDLRTAQEWFENIRDAQTAALVGDAEPEQVIDDSVPLLDASGISQH